MPMEELSDRVDIPVDCLKDVEEGRRRLARATIKEMADIFHVSEESLLALNQPQAPLAQEQGAEVTQEGIGRKIRDLREQRGLTLSQVSQRAGLSAAHVSEVERGLSAASLKTLEKLAEVLEVSTAVLLGKDECDPLGERMRRLRERMGLTQKELAESVEVSHALVGQIENGRLTPSVATLSKLATALGVSPCYFLIEEEDVPWKSASLDESVMRALNYPEARDFMAMVGTLPDDQRERVLGLLAWLGDCFRKFGRAGSCSTDPVAQEMLSVMADLSVEDKQFLLENARFISRKGKP